MLVHVLQAPSFIMNWVDDDPCECCGSQEHLFKECYVLYEKVQAYKDWEDSLIGWYGYKRADYENLNGPSSHHQYIKPRPPNYQEYYYSEMDYHYEQERSYNNYEPERHISQVTGMSMMSTIINTLNRHMRNLKIQYFQSLMRF
ncbi:hypothetical protein Hanom_Chr01g00026381 [Helianthus anomalus]